MSRRKLREYLFKLVFLADFYESDERSGQADSFLEEEEIGEADRALLKERFLDLSSRLEEIDRELNATSKGWRTGRMARTDLALLRLALYEMRFDETVPDGVAISEAVELAKKYGGEESFSFVNGILGSLSRGQESGA